jgi:WD40 repeat protein
MVKVSRRRMIPVLVSVLLLLPACSSIPESYNANNVFTAANADQAESSGNPNPGDPSAVLYSDFRDESSANLRDNDPRLVSLLERLKGENAGVAGWLVGFANAEKIVFYNHAHLLTYSIPGRRFSCALDLQAIDAGHIQGSIVTYFSFSPDGNYVVINNGLSEQDTDWQAKMFLASLQDGSVLEIAAANHQRIHDSWSPGSRYYAFAAADGTGVTVYDVATRAKKNVAFGQGQIKRILVTDKGDLVMEAGPIFLAFRDKGYIWQNPDLKGNLLAVSESTVVYADRKNVRQYGIGSGKDLVLNSLPPGLELRDVNRGQAVFTPGGSSAPPAFTVVYTIAANCLHTYPYTYDSFPQLQGWSFSPGGQYCIALDGDHYRLIDGQGKEERLETVKNQVNYHCAWIDNTAFADVLILGETNLSAGDFAIVVYDLQTKQRKILYEQIE